MKKLLLSSAALCGLAMVATPASAQISLDVGGHFKGYAAYVDQDENNGNVNDIDFIRNTEVHLSGETTLDTGLTVGFHTEAEVDATQNDLANNVGGDSFNVDESYIYMSGSWGRVNVGDEDGASYLLQVAAPSADSNIDGIRQFVNPVNYGALLTVADAAAAPGLLPIIGAQNSGGIDYDADASGKSTKLTYLSPIVSGFQLGLSYSPDTDAANENGIGTDDIPGEIGATYEVAGRYEGNFNNVGFILGAGYSSGDLEADLAGFDDREVFNVGVDLDLGPIGIGAIYREDNGGVDGATADDEETIVVGVDYTTGPFKLGASYYTQDNTFAIRDLDTERYSGGVAYSYGPGMSFRGSVGYVEHDGAALTTDVDATYVTLGTQINF